MTSKYGIFPFDSENLRFSHILKVYKWKIVRSGCFQKYKGALVLQSEKPYAKLENVISRYRAVFWKKLFQKLNSTMRYGIPKIKVAKS